MKPNTISPQELGGILGFNICRNEMSVAWAVLRLEQAALVVGNLEIFTGMD